MVGGVDDVARTRGRPFDPAVGEAALQATLALLAERGYSGLRVADVARRAGIGLGALYRRWPDKQSLILEALRGAAADRDPPYTDDPLADLVAGLEALAEGFAKRARPFLEVVLSGSDPQLAEAIREAKIAPLRAANRERLRRVMGDRPDLDVRADAGPALIILSLVVHGGPPSPRRIRDEILPVMLAGTGVRIPPE
jgi:AcrR family transcriptional regulator